MAGTDNRKNRAEMSRQMSPHGVERVLFAVVAWAAAGCSGLADGADTYCLTDGQGIGAGCGTGGTSGSPDGVDPATAGWWCLGQPPVDPKFMPGNRAALLLPVLEWSTRTPLMDRGLQATFCANGDITCAFPLAGPIPISSSLLAGSVGMLPPGVAGVPVTEGFDGFIKFDVVPDPSQGTPPEDQQFVSDYLYLNGIIAGPVSQGQPVLMFQRRYRQGIIQATFPSADVNAVVSRGSVAVGVYDCDGKAVEGARVELTSEGKVVADALPFVLPASRIPVAQPPDKPLVTQVAGSAGFLNVPLGSVLLTGYLQDGTRIGQVPLGSVAGQLTIGTIRPDYVRKADITGSIKVENPSTTTAP